MVAATDSPTVNRLAPGEPRNSTMEVTPTTKNSSKNEFHSEAEEILFQLLNLDLNDENYMAKLELNMAALHVLVKLHPSVFRRQYKFDCFRDAEYPLCILCVLKAPQSIIETVYRLHPEAGRDGLLVICSFDHPSLEVIRWLVEQDPSIVKQKTRSGNTLLHFACRYGASIDIIKFLYEKYPTALDKTNTDGNSPLHELCIQQKGASTALEKFKHLLTADESKGDKLVGEWNQKHLVKALSNGGNMTIAKFLLKAYPKLLSVQDTEFFWSPLHHVCNSSNSKETIGMILAKCPEAAQMEDKQGRFPLAMACKNETVDDDLLELIVMSHPDAADAVDSSGNPNLDGGAARRMLARIAQKYQPFHQQQPMMMSGVQESSHLGTPKKENGRK